jgi:ParB family transcriptional regulator, chromosome partitioning protein
MSKKRRVFDIDLPEEESAETFPAGKVSEEAPRRGPMAAAISENADSLRDRETIAAQIRAENDALAHEHVRLKQAGLITDLIALDQIDAFKLVRDRHKGPDPELDELVTSIKAIGLSNPIRVEPNGEGGYELVQGYRRLAAYRQLLEETGDDATYGRIPAGIVARGEALEKLYRRMVDENLVRKDISFAEMARLAVEYASDPGTSESDPDKAVALLFQSASYSKRSYIRGFIRLVERLGEELMYPAEIPRALGLSLSARIEEQPGIVLAIKADLKGFANRSPVDELAVLRRYAGEAAEEVAPEAKPAKAGVSSAKAKTSFQITRPQGTAKCVAGAGRLEIRLPRDFSTIDRLRLEAAVRALLDQLD